VNAPGDVKAQWVRVLDVVALGPFTIWAGIAARDLPVAARIGLVLTGAGTILYNGINLAVVEDRRKRCS
jgi:hypothetical protein